MTHGCSVFGTSHRMRWAPRRGESPEELFIRCEKMLGFSFSEKNNTFTMDLPAGGEVVSELGPGNVAQAGRVQCGSSTLGFTCLL